ncbi:ferrous iron transporter B [Terriglobus albidus]|uniref:Ferrous iron transporter B n=1 Tax=Terriglobus albidus TaxID=1592106 RepID=A0A5B9EDG6_9BACT|nr:ferrous iron transporter B [Terriglobus albidus]QEE29694.1 ferrous iron transporter B [Terriglobus albidus]
MSSCCTPAESNAAVLTAPPLSASHKGQIRTIALIGPPNCGKSTLFNRLTGLRQKVGNYPGVTVEHHSGRMKAIGRSDLTLIDLPGIYSLATFSEDARVAVDVLKGQMPGVAAPDAVLLVLDSTHMNRQLMLAAPILALGLPTLVILNMSDVLESRGGKVDVLAMARELGHPVALISAAKGVGLDRVADFLSQYGNFEVTRPGAVKLPVIQSADSYRKWATQVSSRTQYQQPNAPKWTRRLDHVLLHRVWGPLIFLAVVIAVFQVVFGLGQPLSDGLGNLLTGLGVKVAALLPDGWMRALLRDGLWNGVQSVLVFLPQILLLFAFIGILEDSGYLARAALIADRVMRSIGLNGKAFIPLLSAYACAVPAIMATRTIENKRDRFATILVAPFMTCSARLPVYTLIIAAFVPDRKLLGSFVGLRATVMLSLYVLGFLAALFTARVLKSSLLKASSAPFILELPQYRWPTLQGLGIRLYDRAKLFLRKAGTIILGVTFAVWVLSVLPVHSGQFSELTDSVIGHVGHWIEPVIRPLGFNWKIGIGLLSSIVAREVIVGTLGTLYGVDPETHAMGLQQALRGDMTLGGALALVVFFAFALQCTSTIIMVRRETNSWRWPAIQFTYMTVFAYTAALVTNQIVNLIAR